MFSKQPKTEGHAAHSREVLGSEVQRLVPRPENLEGQGKKPRENAHSDHRSECEGGHVKNTRGGSLGRGHHEQGETAASRHAMHQTDREGAKAETKRVGVLMNRLSVRLVGMEMSVDLLPVMLVRVSMKAKARTGGPDGVQAEHHQHDRHDYLEA